MIVRMARKKPDELERLARRAAAGDLESAERLVALLRERKRAGERQDDARGPLRRWTVSGDVRVAFAEEVHARSAAEAEARVLERDPRRFDSLTWPEAGEGGVEVDGVHDEEEVFEEDETSDAYYCLRCGTFLEDGGRELCPVCEADVEECDGGCCVHEEGCDGWCDHHALSHVNACLGSDRVEEIKFERRRQR